MAISVIPYQVHPAARVSRVHTPGQLYTKYEVVEVYLVTGLDDGIPNESALALARTLSAQGIPREGTRAPGEPGRAGSIALQYDTLINPDSDNSVYLLVTYRNPTPGSPVGFTVSDDTVLVREQTELHPKDKSPLLGYYQAAMPTMPNPPRGVAMIFTPDKPAPPETIPLSFPFNRPLRKVVISGYVVGKDLTPARAAVGSVNDSTWLNLDVGFWRMDEFRADGVIAGSIVKVTAGMTTRVNENWMQWMPFRSPDLGRRITVAQKDVDALKKLGYFYGQDHCIGLTVAGLHPTVNFKKLFGVG
ncbi:MAG TPA: hypothetical protein VFC78_15375 [Tepidisphaeraceae bacterium]|nr:hypothetical protein [Tepidisphaeraceae bacterium]